MKKLFYLIMMTMTLVIFQLHYGRGVSIFPGNTTPEETVPATSVAESSETPTQPASTNTGRNYLIMGDSRSVCMYCSQIYDAEEFPKHIFYNIDEFNFTGHFENSTFVVKGGEGLAWLQTTGWPIAQNWVNDNTVLVLWFGVNDLGNISEYITYLNNTMANLNIPVFYMTIGPCREHWSDSNPQVAVFNETLRTQLSPNIHLIDAWSYLEAGLNDGRFATMDGLHYNYETSRAMYQFLIEQVNATLDGQ